MTLLEIEETNFTFLPTLQGLKSHLNRDVIYDKVAEYYEVSDRKGFKSIVEQVQVMNRLS